MMKWIRSLWERFFAPKPTEELDLKAYLMGGHITKTTGRQGRKK